MTSPKDCKLLGRWRITGADIWDADYLDLGEPATVTFKDDGYGEIAFGAMQACLTLEYAKTIVFFTWEGFDEMDDVRGTGSADLEDDGTLTIEFAYFDGDEAELKAVRA